MYSILSSLKLLRTLTDLAWNIPNVERVYSLANYQKITNDNDDLIISDMVYSNAGLDNIQVQKIRAEVIADEHMLGYLLDGEHKANIYVDFKPLDKDKITLVRQLLNIEEGINYFENDIEMKFPVTLNILGGYYNQTPISHGYYELPILIKPGLDLYESNILPDLGELTDWIRKQEGVAFVLSFNDIVKKIQSTYDMESFSSKYASTEVEIIRQLMLIHEMSLPYGLDTSNLKSMEGDKLYLHIILKKDDENLAIELLQQIQSKLQELTSGRLSIVEDAHQIAIDS